MAGFPKGCIFPWKAIDSDHAGVGTLPNSHRWEDWELAIKEVKFVLDNLCYPHMIGFLHWERAQFEVKAGWAQGFFAASRSKSRDAYARLSASFAPQKWFWILKKENQLLPGYPSFVKAAKATAVAGSNMVSWLRGNGYNLRLQPKSTMKPRLYVLITVFALRLPAEK